MAILSYSRTLLCRVTPDGAWAPVHIHVVELPACGEVGNVTDVRGVREGEVSTWGEWAHADRS